MRRVMEVIAAFDAVHGRGAALREGGATLTLMASFWAIAWMSAAIWGDLP
jgi:hypothetical protein